MKQPRDKVCVIITGGTVLETEGQVLGVKQESDISAWLAAMPEITLIAADLTVKLFHGGSAAEVRPGLWLQIARFIFAERNNFRGFVILGSIDNLPYFYYALNLMLENTHQPVVLTGSQLPDYLLFDSTGLSEILAISLDAGIRANLINSLQVVAGQINGVYLMFGDKLIGGRGIHLKQPLLAMPYAHQPNQVLGKVEFNIKMVAGEEEAMAKRAESEMRLRDSLETRVKFFNLGPFYGDLDLATELANARGAIFSLPPGVDYPAELIKHLRARRPRLPVIFTGSALILPLAGNQKLKTELEQDWILLQPAGSTEELAVKFMWVLGQTQDFGEIKKMLGETL